MFRPGLEVFAGAFSLKMESGSGDLRKGIALKRVGLVSIDQ
jgi:hypothetical protein